MIHVMCMSALLAHMYQSSMTSRRRLCDDTCYASAVLRYQHICVIVAQHQGGQYVMIHVMRLLCCAISMYVS